MLVHVFVSGIENCSWRVWCQYNIIFVVSFLCFSLGSKRIVYFCFKSRHFTEILMLALLRQFINICSVFFQYVILILYCIFYCEILCILIFRKVFLPQGLLLYICWIFFAYIQYLFFILWLSLIFFSKTFWKVL